MRARILRKSDGALESDKDQVESECIGFTSVAQAKTWFFDMGYGKSEKETNLLGQIFKFVDGQYVLFTEVFLKE